MWKEWMCGMGIGLLHIGMVLYCEEEPVVDYVHLLCQLWIGTLMFGTILWFPLFWFSRCLVSITNFRSTLVQWSIGVSSLLTIFMYNSRFTEIMSKSFDFIIFGSLFGLILTFHINVTLIHGLLYCLTAAKHTSFSSRSFRKRPWTEAEGNETCAICYEPYLRKKGRRKTWAFSCDHACCKQCIRAWIKQNPTCPFCRSL